MRSKSLSWSVVLVLVTGVQLFLKHDAEAVYVVDGESTWIEILPHFQLDKAVVVQDGGVLTINPGVNALWVETDESEIGGITVRDGGTLIAIGTPGNPITFQSSHSQGWRGIYIENGATATLEYCSLLGTGYANTPLLTAGLSDTIVRHCTINGSAGHGIHLNSAGNHTIIEDITIINCAGHAIYQNTGDMNPQIAQVNFDGNAENAVFISAGTPAVAGVFREVNWRMTGAPYVISGWYRVGENGVLSIEPGVRVEFTESPSALQSHIAAVAKGRVNILGTPGSPVLLTSHETEPEPGDWAYLAVDENGAGTWENLIVEYAGQWGSNSVRIASSEVTIQNMEIRNGLWDGLWLDEPFIVPALNGLHIHHTTGWPLVMRTNDMNPDIGEALHFHDNPSGNGILVLAGSGFQTTGSAEWTVNSVPYVISGWYRIGNESVFSIQPGVNVSFTESGVYLQSNIEVMNGGTLSAQGTPAKPILFGSFKETPVPGDWAFLQVDQGGKASFDNCRIRHAGRANSPALIIASSEVEVNNLLIEECVYDGIRLDNTGITPTLSNIVVRNCGGWGIVQSVMSMMPAYSNISLYANTGGNGIVMWAGTGGPSITQNLHWRFCGAPYAISGWARFAQNTHLEIDPGVIVQFAQAPAALQSNFELNTGCSLTAHGTPSQRILFTSYKPEPVPGDWEFIKFPAGSSGSFDYCTIEYANGSALEIRTSSLVVKNTIIRNANWYGVWVWENQQPTFINNQIEGNRTHGFMSYSPNYQDYPVDLRGTWWGDVSGPYHARLNPAGLGNEVTDGCLFQPWATAPFFGPLMFAWPPTVRIDMAGGDGFVSVANTGAGDFNWNAQVTSGQQWLSIQTAKAGEQAGFTVLALPYDGTLQRVGQILLSPSGPGMASKMILVAQPGTEGAGPPHTADRDQDMQVSLSELLRVIQFYNSPGFHCDDGTEDGYMPGPGATDCTPHNSDYISQDWQVTLSELLRLVQFYNSGGYHQNVDGEDGFGPGLLL